MKKLLLLTTTLMITALLSAQWSQVSPHPTSQTLQDIRFTPNNLGLAVGSQGTIVRTTDGGQNWLPVPSGTAQNLNEVCFSDDISAFVVGDSGTLIKSVDGGQSWMHVSMPDSIHLYGICFINSTKGWVAGADNHHGYIFHTDDEGSSWSLKYTRHEFQLKSVTFINDTNGWAAGPQGIICTNDGGSTWNTQFTGNSVNLEYISFSDPAVGWALGGHLVLHTLDGGINWLTDTIYFEECSGLNDMVFISEQHGFIAGDGNNMGNSFGFMLETLNGGDEWTWANPLPAGASLNGICAIGPDTIWAVGRYGNIVHSADAGNSWEQQTGMMNDLTLKDIFFANESNGWIIGNIPYQVEKSKIFRTSDGGMNWDPVTSFYYQDWYTGMFFLDENNGWIWGYSLLKTDDGGASWELPEWPYGGYQCNDLVFVDSQHGWLADQGFYYSTIYSTVDGGQNWTIQHEAQDSWIRHLYFIDEGIGWALGMTYPDIGNNYGFILNTTNAGNTWDQQLTSDYMSFIAIYFPDANNGVTLTANGRVCFTEDGGNNWTEMGEGIDDTCSDGWFTGLNTAWMVSEGGKIYYTYDKGLNWVRDEAITSSDLTRVIFTKKENGYILGDHATLLQTTNGGISGMSGPPSGPPVHLETFPNPNSGTLKLKYLIAGKQSSILELFSANGSKVKILMQKLRYPGTYEENFDISDLPDGIYFVRLQAGEQAASAKIVLNK